MARIAKRIFEDIARVVEKEITDLVGIQSGSSEEFGRVLEGISKLTAENIRQQVKEFKREVSKQAFATFFEGLKNQPIKSKAKVKTSRVLFDQVQKDVLQSLDQIVVSYLYNLEKTIEYPEVQARFRQTFYPTSGLAREREVVSRFTPKVTYPLGKFERSAFEKIATKRLAFERPPEPTSTVAAIFREETLWSVYKQTFANILRQFYAEAAKESLFELGVFNRKELQSGVRQILYGLQDVISQQSEILLDAYSRGIIPALRGVSLTKGSEKVLKLTLGGKDLEKRLDSLNVEITDSFIKTVDTTLRSLEQAIFEEKIPLKGLTGGIQPRTDRYLTAKTARLEALFSKPRYAPLAAKVRELAPDLLSLPEEYLKRVDIETIYGGVTRARISYFDQETRAVKSLSLAMDKYGNVLVDTAARFRSFIDGVKRDIREFTKWTTAITLVYLPLQALQGSLAAAIEQESLLASVLITLGKSQEYANKTFEDAAKIADETGQAISSILKGYNLALRAAGNITDYNERVAKANELMRDSIMLSILSGMDQAAATDTLVAALKQMGLEVDQGTTLLDKWVKVSKIANVDVETLATSFAIVGESAKQAGISIDELNGIIAIVAAAGITNAKETGNAVRAIISGLTADRTANELRKYGIAVTDTSGKLRDFKSIVDDIRGAFLQGLISPDQLNRLAYIIGGGNRRQAQVVTALVQFGDVTRIAGESAKASGDAWEAFKKKLETTQISTVRLSNAFQVLIRSVFTRGGILDGLKSLIELTTSLTNAVSGLTSTLGTAVPAFLALGAGKLFKVGPRFREILYSLGTSVIPPLVLPFTSRAAVQAPAYRLEAAAGGLELTPQRAAQINAALLGEKIGYRLQLYAPQIGAMLAVSFMAALEFAKTKDAKQAGLVIAGGILGGLLSKGSPVGFLIGATAAEVFANKLGETKIKLQQAEIPKEIIQAAGGEFKITATKTIYDLGRSLLSIFGKEIPNLTEEQFAAVLATLPKKIGPYSYKPGMSPEEVARLLYGTRFATQTLGYQTVKQVFIDRQLLQAVQQDVQQQLDAMFYTAKPKLSEREFGNAKERLSGLSSFAQNATVPIKELGISLADLDVKSLEDFYRSLAEILALSPEDRLDRINTTLTELITLLEKLGAPGAENGIQVFDQFTEELITIPANEARKKVNDLAQQFVKEFKAARDYIQVSLANLPSFDILSDLTQKDVETAIKYAEKYANEILPLLTEGQRKALEEQAKDLEIFVRTSEGIWKQISGLPAMFFREGLDLAKSAGEIIGKGIGIQKIDIGSEQLGTLLSQVEVLWQQLNRAFGYQGEKETVIALLNDNQFRKITTDMTLLRLLLDQISENTAKQLEGVYNLPEGAEFFVPWQAAAMASKNSGGVDFDSLIKSLSVVADEQASAIDNQTAILSNKLDELKQAYLESAAKERERIFGKPATVEPTTEKLAPLSRGDLAYAERYKGLADFYQRQTQKERQMEIKPPAFIGKELLPYDPIEKFFEFFGRLFNFNLGPLGPSVVPKIPGQTSPTAMQNFRLNISSNINLLLDGRVLAQVVRQYMTAETLRFSVGQSTISKQVVI